MSETRNIVILGASLSGLSAAHYLAKHTLPKLKNLKDAKYVLHLADPSTHFWWHIAAPRAIVSVQKMKHSDCFVPIKNGFNQYPDLKDSIFFHQAEATGVDTGSRSVAVQTSNGYVETLEYYALIIATGIKSPTPLTTLHGDHTISQNALDAMNAKIASAKDIVIGGGGPVGVEIAGELGEHFKGKANITLIAGSNKLLPRLRKSLSDKAQKLLENLRVTVRYDVKVTKTATSSDGKIEIRLSNGETLSTDVYLPATGATPNSSFLPPHLKQKNGCVNTNQETMRVDDAGPRVYAVGDVAGVNTGGVLNIYTCFPVAAANISHDLLADAELEPVPEKIYQRKDTETQVVSIGANAEVGAFNGWQMPSFLIAWILGKDYRLGGMPDFTEGKKWTKP